MSIEHRTADTTHPLKLNHALSIDHKRSGKVQCLERTLGRRISWVQPDRETEPVIFHKLQNIFRWITIVDGNHHKPLIFVLLIEGLQSWHFLLARRAPRC